MSLYRQYRPQDFASLMGQDHVCEVLQGALKQDKVSHAYLFTGPRGTGKTSTARILARAINCQKPSAKGPCNKCTLCTSALEESLTDLVEIDAASHGLVDDARALVEQARFMPVQAKKKIYIIDEVHMLSKSAFNALLKIIEEPPEHVHFILATTESHKVLETIKSRCQRFDFHLADESLIVQRLQEVCKAEKSKPKADALELLAKHARGSFRDGLSLLEQVIGKKNFTLQDVQETLGLSESASVEAFVAALIDSDRDTALGIIADMHQQGLDLYQFCQAVLEKFRRELLSAENSQQAQLLTWVEVFFTALDQLRDPVVPELPLEMAVMKCLAQTNSAQTPVDPAPAVDKTPVQQPAAQATAPPPEPVKKTATKPAKGIKSKPKASSQAFDQEQFVNSIKQASLKMLLKYSQLQYDGTDLTILARSEFELGKMKAKENQSYIAEVAQEIMGQQVGLQFGIAEASAAADKSDDGLSVQDLESVF